MYSMGKKNWAKTWVNQGEIGREFGLPAVMTGRKLDEAGLRADRLPTQAAFDGGLAHAAPLANGTPNFRWHKQKTIAALVAAGLTRRDPGEVREAGLDAEAREIAREILRLESSEDGMDQKMAYLLWGETPAQLRDRVDALVREGR
jgi:hypothetical protein